MRNDNMKANGNKRKEDVNTLYRLPSLIQRPSNHQNVFTRVCN